jgi:hypothetical protein
MPTSVAGRTRVEQPRDTLIRLRHSGGYERSISVLELQPCNISVEVEVGGVVTQTPGTHRNLDDVAKDAPAQSEDFISMPLISDAVPFEGTRGGDTELHSMSGPPPATPSWVVTSWRRASQERIAKAKSSSRKPARSKA